MSKPRKKKGDAGASRKQVHQGVSKTSNGLPEDTQGAHRTPRKAAPQEGGKGRTSDSQPPCANNLLAAYRLAKEAFFFQEYQGDLWVNQDTGDFELGKRLLHVVLRALTEFCPRLDSIQYDDARQTVETMMEAWTRSYGNPEHVASVQDWCNSARNEYGNVPLRSHARAAREAWRRAAMESPLHESARLLCATLDNSLSRLSRAESAAYRVGRWIGLALAEQKGFQERTVTDETRGELQDACQAALIPVHLPATPPPGDGNGWQALTEALERHDRDTESLLEKRGNPRLIVNLETGVAWLGGARLALPDPERRLLRVLVEADGTLLTKQQLEDKAVISEGNIDAYKSRLLGSLRDAAKSAPSSSTELPGWVDSLIKTERNKGLRLGVPSVNIAILSD